MLMTTQEEFAAICEEFISRERELLGIKGGDYATKDDRLWNFNIIAPLQGVKPSEVCVSYLLKHLVTIIKAVKEGSGAWAWETVKGEGLKQRIADARNYLLLLAALLEVERNLPPANEIKMTLDRLMQKEQQKEQSELEKALEKAMKERCLTTTAK